MDGQNDATSTNPYMALRAAKIARNQARLRELGLYKPDFSKKAAAASNRKRGQVIKQKKNHEVSVPTGPRRRSARISGLANNPDYKESNDFKDPVPFHQNTRKRGTKRLLDVDENPVSGADQKLQTQSKLGNHSRQEKAPMLAVNSVRTISLDVSVLLEKFLAKPLDTFGKYHVIEKSFHESAYPEDLQRLEGVSRLSFNKFSGVQPWKNVIFLWINLGGPTGPDSLVNDFSHNGSRVKWFGGSKMREDSPIIQNLIRMGKESASNPPPLTSAIILWCRQYDWGTKKLLPYTCLGRLAYESHVVGSQPVAFTWRLIDYDAIFADKSTRTVFQEITGLE